MATEQDFSERYAALNTAELLATARVYDSLTDLAQSALRAEFAKRGMEAPLLEERPYDEPEGRKLLTLRRYRDLSEAIVARGMLESAGISVYLQDENLVRLDWQVSNFIGGIRLQVEQSDAEAAAELLEQPVPESIPFAGPFDATDPEFEQPRCPKCGSLEISFDGAYRGASMTGLYAMGLPLPTGRESWSCGTCGARWEDSNSSQ